MPEITPSPWPQDFKDYVLRVLVYLQREIGHREYSFDMMFCYEAKYDDGHRVNADITVDDVYLNYVVRLYPVVFEWWNEKEYEDIGHTLCHEIAHIITHPLHRLAITDVSPYQEKIIREVNERQTQRIANLVGWNLPKEWYHPDKLVKLEEAYTLSPDQVALVTKVQPNKAEQEAKARIAGLEARVEELKAQRDKWIQICLERDKASLADNSIKLCGYCRHPLAQCWVNGKHIDACPICGRPSTWLPVALRVCGECGYYENSKGCTNACCKTRESLNG